LSCPLSPGWPLRFSVKAKPLRGAFGSLDPAPTLRNAQETA